MSSFDPFALAGDGLSIAAHADVVAQAGLLPAAVALGAAVILLALERVIP